MLNYYRKSYLFGIYGPQNQDYHPHSHRHRHDFCVVNSWCTFSLIIYCTSFFVSPRNLRGYARKYTF